MLGKDNHQVNFAGAYGLAAAPVRLLLEEDRWAEAAALSSELPAGMAWDNFPQTVAMLWFAKGLGAAWTGDVEAAEDAVGELDALLAAMRERGPEYWARLTEGKILSIRAWIALAEGDGYLAVTLQTQAADLEDEIGRVP